MNVCLNHLILFLGYSSITRKKVRSCQEKYFEGPDQAIDEKVEERLEQKRVLWQHIAMPYFSVLEMFRYGIGWRPKIAEFENC